MNTAALLSSFLRGRLSVHDFGEQLSGLFELDYSGASRRIVRVNAEASIPSVIFSRADVRRALERCLAFQISDKELSDWAATIRLLDSHFDLERSDPDPEMVWDIIDHLAAPNVWGELTRASLEEMLTALSDTHGGQPQNRM